MHCLAHSLAHSLHCKWSRWLPRLRGVALIASVLLSLLSSFSKVEGGPICSPLRPRSAGRSRAECARTCVHVRWTCSTQLVMAAEAARRSRYRRHDGVRRWQPLCTAVGYTTSRSRRRHCRCQSVITVTPSRIDARSNVAWRTRSHSRSVGRSDEHRGRATFNEGESQ